MATVEQMLRALYDRAPDDLQPRLRRSYHWAKIRTAAARTRASIHPRRQVAFLGYEVAHLEESEILGPGPDQALVETHCSAISPGTETNILRGLPGTPRRFPYQPGYSGAGIVLKAGSQVKALQPGHRVAGGICHASHENVRAAQLVKVPENVSLEDASFATIAAISMQGVRKATIEPGDRVVVVGQGLIGQLATRFARLATPSELTGIGHGRGRAARAMAPGGADDFVALTDPDADARLEALQADVVIEAAGTPASLNTSLRCIGHGGRLVVLGSGRALDRDAIWAALVERKRITVIGAHITTMAGQEPSAGRFTYQQEMAFYLDLLRHGRLRVDDLIDWRVTPDQCNHVYEQLASGRSKHTGIVFHWRGPRPAEPNRAEAPPGSRSHSTTTTVRPSMEPLRIGMIGAGAIALHNAREASKTPAVKVAAVYDTNQKASSQLASAYSATSYPTYEALLNSRDVDAVLLNVPHHLHRDLAVQAAVHGKHVLLEKPMASTLDEAHDIITACALHGVSLSVNFSLRFIGRSQESKRLIEEGALGTVIGVQSMHYSYREPGYWFGARSPTADTWRQSKAQAGAGFLFMNLCHVIDYVYFLTGLRASRVYCEYGTLGSPTEVEDSVSISCRFDNGAIGTFGGGTVRRGADQAEDRIWGTNGSMEMTNEGITFHSTRPIRGRRPGKTAKITGLAMANWVTEWLAQSAAAIREGRPMPITGQDGWHNLAFITTALRSMEEGRSLAVPEYPATL